MNPAPKIVVIIGSTTESANIVAIAASTALPPWTSISVPANEASGWFDVTIPRAPIASCFSVLRAVAARVASTIAVPDIGIPFVGTATLRRPFRLR